MYFKDNSAPSPDLPFILGSPAGPPSRKDLFCYFRIVAFVRTMVGAAGVSAVLFALTAGCGSDKPPPAGYGGDTVPPVSGGGLFGSDAGSAPPGCGQAPDGTVCACIDVPLFEDPPNIYFVRDRSGSMAEDNKWTQVRIVIGKIMRALGPRAAFGATMYPAASTSDACVAGGEIMSIRPGDPPSSTVDGPTTTFLLTATRVAPSGGTPTGATMNAVFSRIAGVPGKTFVILATDGAPNCGTSSCGVDMCMPNMENAPGCPKGGSPNCCEAPTGTPQNCLDAQATANATAALRTAGIPTYVIGLPGAAPYAAVLDQVAIAGGTPLAGSPKYFAVTSADQTVLLNTLKKVAAKIVATCTYTLKEAPQKPELVNVYLDDVALPFEPGNGWTIDGNKVTLQGSACERVTNGDVLSVRIIAGCPRIEPR